MHIALYYKDFSDLEEPLAVLPRNNGEGGYISERLLELPQKWMAASFNLKKTPDPSDNPKPALHLLKVFFKTARHAVQFQPKTFDEELERRLTPLWDTTASVVEPNRPPEVRPNRSDRPISTPTLNELLSAYAVQVGYDQAIGPWVSIRVPRLISARMLGRSLNEAIKPIRGDNIICPDYLNDRMPDTRLRVKEYKATLYLGTTQNEFGEEANRAGQKAWLRQRGQKFTREAVAAILSAFYYGKTAGQDFFLGEWGRVAGSRALALFPYGVDDDDYDDGDAYYNVRAVGSPRIQNSNLAA